MPPEVEGLSAPDQQFVSQQANSLAYIVRSQIDGAGLSLHNPMSSIDSAFYHTRVNMADHAARQGIGSPAELSAATQKMMSAVMADPAMRKVLPELALTELNADFDRIHNPEKGKVMTLDELKEFGSRINLSSVQKAALDFSIGHFDQLRAFTEAGAQGLSQDALHKGMSKFSKLDAEVEHLERARSLSGTLDWLNSNYDKIHLPGAKGDGLSNYELELFSGHAEQPEVGYLAAQAIGNFNRIRGYGMSADGKSSMVWRELSGDDLMRRTDITAGINMAKSTRIDDINRELLSWTEK